MSGSSRSPECVSPGWTSVAMPGARNATPEASLTTRPLHVRTPLLENITLSQIYGQKVYLKMDNVQASGSFKIRGMGRLCQEAQRQGAKRVVIASGGNAGMAVAYSARQLHMESVVVLSKLVPHRLVDRLRLEGARVEVKGSTWEEADDRARQIVAQEGGYYCHPFDNPLIWTGNSTMIPEIFEDLCGVAPGAIVASVGGGGLVCGIAEGLDKVGWSQVPIVAVETKGADSFRASINANKQVTLPTITSIAAALAVRKVCTKILELYKTRPIFSVVLSDKLAVDACVRFSEDQRALVEPACGASLAAVYGARTTEMRKHGRLPADKPIVVIVCGGSAASIKQLEEWQEAVQRNGCPSPERDHTGID